MGPSERAHPPLIVRTAVAAGALGPAAFIGAWVIAGLAADSYSPVDRAVSELAEQGAPTRATMTAGFVAFGIGVGAFAIVLRRLLPGPAWAALLVAAIATIGAAVFPLGGPTSSAVHGAFAGLGYLALSLSALLAAPSLAAAGRRAESRLSIVASAVTGTCLIASLVVDSNGLFQRLGLTTIDVWIMGLAWWVREGDLARHTSQPAAREVRYGERPDDVSGPTTQG